MSEFEHEPVRGLPQRLPAGERILWQGEPRVAALARRVFHLRKLALYCGLLLVWRVASGLSDGEPLATIATFCLWLVPFAVIVLGLPLLLAWLYARATVYTITNRRVVIRSGVALPMSINLPFRLIGAAGLKVYADGSGDIPLSLTGSDRIAYLHLWPNVRPWRVTRPEPMLRGIPDAAEVAELLADALAAAPATKPQAAEARRPAEAGRIASAAA
jgi:Bacterial PH domain